MRDEKGITLSALVITIIVLIIISSIAVSTATGTIKYSKFSKAKSEMQLMVANVNSWNEEYNKLTEQSEKTAYIQNYGVETSDSSCDANALNKTVNGVDHLTDSNKGNYRYLSSSFLKNNLGLDDSYEFLVDIEGRDVILFNGITYEDKTYYTPEDFGITNVANTITADATSFSLAQPDLENNIVIYNIGFKDNNGNPMDISKYKIEYNKDGDSSWHNITNKVTKTTYEGNNGFKFPLTETGTYNVKVSTIDNEVRYTESIPFYKYIDLAAYQELDERNIIIYGVLFKDITENATRIKINDTEVTITKVTEGNEYKAQLENGREVTYPTYIYSTNKRYYKYK